MAGSVKGKTHVAQGIIRRCADPSREETIIVNRVLREDPSKSDMHNREPVTPKLLWKSLMDFDLWPLYIIGLMFQIPTVPMTSYLTLTLKNLGWSTFNVNLLTIPYYVAHSRYFLTLAIWHLVLIFTSPVFTMLGLTYLGELWNELTLTAMIGQLWTLPLLIAMVALNLATTNNWVVYAILVLLLIYPNGTLGAVFPLSFCAFSNVLHCFVPSHTYLPPY